MSEVKPVLTIGAGPTGMTAAMELARFGIPVRLVEKTSKPATTSRAVGVQARTLELFEQRGMSLQLVKRRNQGIGVSAYGGGKRVFRLEFKTIDSKYKYILFISQAETEKTLRDALERESIKIEWKTTMIGFSRTEHSDYLIAILRCGDGFLESVDCSYLISAEGAHSTLRETLGLPFVSDGQQTLSPHRKQSHQQALKGTRSRLLKNFSNSTISGHRSGQVRRHELEFLVSHQ
jgi:2-polyprenyl-6-methoxyphenol hydroxylase-like FAD-dependent oxidoreductase